MRRRSVVVPSHQHKSFEIKPLGECRSCDNYHERAGVTAEQIDAALLTAPPASTLRLLAMMRRTDPVMYAERVQWIAEGVALADAVNEAMGEWPDESADSLTVLHRAKSTPPGEQEPATG